MVSLLIIKYGNSDLVILSAPGEGKEAWSRPLIQHGFSFLGFFNLVVMLITIGIIYSFIIKFYQINNGKLDVLLVAGFMPLALFFFGWDYARWVGLIGITILIIFMIKVLINNWTFNDQKIPYSGLIFLLPFGPVGVMNIFPAVRNLVFS